MITGNTISPREDSGWVFPLCPTPPEWRLDWEGLISSFEWIRQMAGVSQEPSYHGEGDVLVHTRMVLEALVSMKSWQNLGSPERSVVFTAALMHDVAKPHVTKTESDGRITSLGHAGKSAKMARNILWQGKDLSHAPFKLRESIANLIRHHSLPLFFWERTNPEKEVFRASQIARMDWLALLAEADVHGRICKDKQELLDRVQLFRELCREYDCYDQPKAFPSDHSRFLYFRKEDRQPDYYAFDDTKFEVTMMSGLPGAGKDTWIRENASELPKISLDEIRETQGCSPTANQGKVIQSAREKAREFMREQIAFVWNATNLSLQLRRPLIDLFWSYGARIRIVYLEPPYTELFTRNSNRRDSLPEKAIHKLIERVDIPDITEAHSVRYIVHDDSDIERLGL